MRPIPPGASLLTGTVRVAEWSFSLPGPCYVQLIANKTQMVFFNIGFEVYTAPLAPDPQRSAAELYQHELQRYPASATQLLEEQAPGVRRFCYEHTRADGGLMLTGALIADSGAQLVVSVHVQEPSAMEFARKVWRSFAPAEVK